MSAQVVPSPKGAGLQGHLRLVCGIDSEGRSHLREQSFSVPVHLSKPFLDNGALVVNQVTPTAGLFSGDRVEVDVRVEPGARMLLTTPSATRVHRMKAGRAKTVQRFVVESEGRLEVWPEILIPQAGSTYRQETRVDVQRGGELLYIEMLAPGRVASGEVFAFNRLDWATDIFYGEEWIARERFRLEPGTPGFDVISIPFPSAYHATCFVVAEKLTIESACWAEILALHGDAVWVGCSRLVRAGWIIKMVARDSIVLREAIGKMRRAIHAAAGWKLPELRRV